MNQKPESNFCNRSPNVYEELQNKANEMACLIEDEIPDGSEKSLSLENLKKSLKWAMAGASRNRKL